MNSWWVPIGSVCSVFLVSELLIRSFVTLPANSIPDPDIGWIYKPHMEILHSVEGFARNTMNSLGLNDQEIDPLPKSPRILVLGDSYTEALQVKQEQNFTSLIESMPPCKKDLLNTGRSGLSPVEYPILASRFKDNYMPDAGLMVVNMGDYSDVFMGETLRNPETNEIERISVRDQSVSPLRKKMDSILSHSALLTFLMYRVKQIIASRDDQPDITLSPKQKNPDTFSIKKLKEVKARFTYLFERINKMLPMYVLYIPKIDYYAEGGPRETSLSARFAKLLADISHKKGVKYLSSKKAIINDFFISGQPAFGFHNKQIGNGHLNEKGHSLIAQSAAKLLSPVCEK